jgi:hypothetical protein
MNAGTSNGGRVAWAFLVLLLLSSCGIEGRPVPPEDVPPEAPLEPASPTAHSKPPPHAQKIAPAQGSPSRDATGEGGENGGGGSENEGNPGKSGENTP